MSRRRKTDTPTRGEVTEKVKENTEKMEEGVELGAEIDVLRQGLYELNERVIQQNNEMIVLRAENQIIKLELCKENNLYSWCK